MDGLDWICFLVLCYMRCIFDGDGRRLCVIKMTPMDGCGRHIKEGFPDLFFLVDVVCVRTGDNDDERVMTTSRRKLA